jgi:Zn-dependent peptidase ImmA (M78 family)
MSKKDIEVVGESVRRDYAKLNPSDIQIPFDISAFAREYLKLEIHHRKLSDNDTILGLTTYKDVQLELEFKTGNIVVSVPKDTILIEENLQKTENQKRGRFTVAHECAHQVIARIEERRTGKSFRKNLIPGKTYSFRDLKMAEDWSEWQANALGAVLLMPRDVIVESLNEGIITGKPTLYGKRFGYQDYHRVKKLSDQFGVSFTAMTLRLRELDFICYKSEYAKFCPFDDREEVR